MLGRREGVWEWDQCFYLRDLQTCQPTVTQHGWTGSEAPEGKINPKVFLTGFRFLTLSSSVTFRVLMFISDTWPPCWQRRWFCRLCLVCLWNWAWTLRRCFHCTLMASSTTGIHHITSWMDSSNPGSNSCLFKCSWQRFIFFILLSPSFHYKRVTETFGFSFYSSLSATMGVHSVLGQAGVQWIGELRSSTSLDGSIQLEEGRDIRVVLSTPEDLMDIISLRYANT